MPGPRKFKATKIGVIITTNSPGQPLEEMFAFLDKLYIKYEIIKDRTDKEFIAYSSLAKRHGLEALIVVANVSDTLPARCAQASLIPLIFAPISGKTKNIPTKNLTATPFASVAVDKPLFAAIYAARIVAIRDKSLHQRLVAIQQTLDTN